MCIMFITHIIIRPINDLLNCKLLYYFYKADTVKIYCI